MPVAVRRPPAFAVAVASRRRRRADFSNLLKPDFSNPPSRTRFLKPAPSRAVCLCSSRRRRREPSTSPCRFIKPSQTRFLKPSPLSRTRFLKPSNPLSREPSQTRFLKPFLSQTLFVAFCPSLSPKWQLQVRMRWVLISKFYCNFNDEFVRFALSCDSKMWVMFCFELWLEKLRLENGSDWSVYGLLWFEIMVTIPWIFTLNSMVEVGPSLIWSVMVCFDLKCYGFTLNCHYFELYALIWSVMVSTFPCMALWDAFC